MLSYLPFTIAAKDMSDRVQEAKPGILTPSSELLHLQLIPINTYTQ